MSEPALARRLRRFTSARSWMRRRLLVPGFVTDRLAPVLVRGGVRFRRFVADFEVDGFRLCGPRRFVRSYLEGYEPEMTAWLRAVIPRGGVVIDAGAHIGYVSLVASRLVGPTGRVLAIEPSRETRTFLAGNVERNAAANVDIVPVALSAGPGIVGFNINASSDSYGMFEHPNTTTTSTELVPTLSLDAVVRGAGLDRLDVIKLDVEGAEPEALDGMSDVLCSFPGVRMVVEWFPSIHVLRGLPSDIVPTRLEALGYTLRVVDPTDGGPIDVAAIRAALGAERLPRHWYCNLVAERA